MLSGSFSLETYFFGLSWRVNFFILILNQV